MITVLIVNILPNSMNPETVSNHSEVIVSFAVYTNGVLKRWGSSKVSCVHASLQVRLFIWGVTHFSNNVSKVPIGMFLSL